MENIQFLSPTFPLYPTSFSLLKQPPVCLFALGNLALLDSPIVTVVGARSCAEESIVLTKQLVDELCASSYTILSGMADGIDTIAHRTCLEKKGNTIAIIGSGFNLIQHRKIAREILEGHGLILSEYFPDTPAMKYHFPRRNQLLVALSSAVIAVETHLHSGTMITATEALAQQVPLYTFPGDVFQEKYAGNNWLLTQGAYCLSHPSAIIDFLQPTTSSPAIISTSPTVPPQFQIIYDALSTSPQHINTLLQTTHLPLPELQTKLLQMEMEDFVEKLSNNYYLLKKHQKRSY